MTVFNYLKTVTTRTLRSSPTRRYLQILKFACALFLGLAFEPLQAVTYHGRFNVGILTTRERIKNEPLGTTTANDIVVISSRFYLDASDLGSPKFQFVADLRDKHDFFDKLDRERLELTASNRFQARQLFLRWHQQDTKPYFTLGRFSAADLGVIYTDGIDVGYKFTSSFKWGFLAGLTPRFDQINALETTRDSYQYGTYLTYIDNGRRWSDYLFFSNLFATIPADTFPRISESATSAAAATTPIDDPSTTRDTKRRSVWVNNTSVQWNQGTRFTNFSTVDLVPKPLAENLWFSWHQQIIRSLNSQLAYLHVNPYEYHRQQELRETLPSTEYRQGTLTLRQTFASHLQMNLTGKYGKRSYDNLEKKSIASGLQTSRFFTANANAGVQIQYQENFVSNNVTLILDYGYFSDRWEFHLTQSGGTEKYRDQDKTLHPTVTELSSSFFWSKLLFSTLSAEYARDERVDIYSLIAKIGYRFGNGEVAPIRDGAPPRGRL